ncbi:hypothetical protein K505DRAFT_416913 [Melanomma pulvis-pyrius CBS 109.77]|uniref:Uncharacterized protein n=1 Tax=Melanomma pulvis-pyrius CBS 109.77 TaxID=1314802 RepID=A0A6A6XFU4_9PLEO|nr:hypothetical protein K505DRAFT_416913 [Melanomma pulvis-pyrius CBS 109.77]
MANTNRILGNAIGLFIAMLYTLAGQAHFTSRLTPDLATNIEEMTTRSHRAFWFLQLSYLQLKQLFGLFDLIAAGLLFRKSTRKAGLRIAVIGFSGGLYGQVYTSGDVGQVAGFLGLACLGSILL